MSTIDIIPIDVTHTITQVQISQMTVDLFSGTIILEVLLKSESGEVIETKSISPSQSDFESYVDVALLDSFVLTQLGFSPQT